MGNLQASAAGRGPTPFVVLGIVVAGANLLIVPLASNSGPRGEEFVALLAAAVLGGQISLVACWGVFGSAPFLVRLSRCAGLGLACYTCLFLGGVMCFERGEFDEFREIMFALLAALPLIFFGVQAPLWMLRLWLGWEVWRPDAAPGGSYTRPVLIKDMVLATAAVSVALAAVRLVLALSPSIPADEFLMAVSVMATAAACVSLVTLPPLVYAVLGSRRIGTAILGVALWCALFDTVCLAAVTLLTGSLPSPPMVTAFSSMSLIFAALVAIGLGLARNRGYRLQWRGLRRELTESEEAWKEEACRHSTS